MENNFKELLGYKVFENGKIIGIKNTELTIKNKTDILKIKTENEYIYIPVMRFIYYAFNPTFDYQDYNLMVVQKRNNDDLGIENLKVVKRSSKIQGENSCNAKLTDEQVKEIIAIYENAKEKGFDKNSPNTNVSYRSLAKDYGVSHSLISGIIKRRFRNKENYKLK